MTNTNSTPGTFTLPKEVTDKYTPEQIAAALAALPKHLDEKEIGKKRDKANYRALTSLKNAHKDEYKQLMTAECKKEGVPAPKFK